MFGYPAKGAHAYAQISIESGALGASPHRLVVLMFDGAITSVSKAMVHMKNNEIAEKGKSLNHAITIVESGLRASLDKKVGGEIALTLDNLYAHIALQLLQANLRNSPEILLQVIDLLKTMRESWDAINPEHAEAKASKLRLAGSPPSAVAGAYRNFAVA